MALTNSELEQRFSDVLAGHEGASQELYVDNKISALIPDLVKVANEHAGKKQYWYKITPGLIDVLRVMLEHVAGTNQNEFTVKELRHKLKPQQYTQSTKLRFHGLIAKIKDDDGKWTGKWLLTRRTGEFMRGEAAIPQKVLVQNNRVIGYDDINVDVREVYGSMPYIERMPEFFAQAKAQAPEGRQTTLLG